MDNYTSSQVSSAGSPISAGSPLTNSPLSTPDTTDLEDAPPLNVADNHGLGLGLHSGVSDPTFVLVIGGLGFIGSHTVLELLRAGFNGMYIEFIILLGAWCPRRQCLEYP